MTQVGTQQNCDYLNVVFRYTPIEFLLLDNGILMTVRKNDMFEITDPLVIKFKPIVYKQIEEALSEKGITSFN